MYVYDATYTYLKLADQAVRMGQDHTNGTFIFSLGRRNTIQGNTTYTVFVEIKFLTLKDVQAIIGLHLFYKAQLCF